MKRFIKNITAFTASAMCAVVGCSLAMATYKPIFEENFESHNVGDALGYASRASTCALDGDNKVVSLGVPESGYDNGRYLVSLSSEPAGKALISLDFKLPGEVNGYNNKLLETYYKEGKGSVSDVLLKNGTVYTANGGSAKEGIRSDIESNKWYNIFIIVDKETKTWKLYSGFAESEATDFTYPDPVVAESEKEVYNKLLWPLSVRNYNKNAPMYVDNCIVTGVLNEELDIAVYKARGIILEAELGYEEGQYPLSAMSMLEDAYEKARPCSEDTSISEEEATQYAEELQKAITLFKNSKIDLSNSEGLPAYMISEVPDIIVIDGEEDYSGQLSAKLYDVANNTVDGDIEWSLEEEYEGISLSDGKLNVSAGAEQIINLKATCGDLYLRQTIKLTTGKEIEEFNFIGENGELEISGSMSRVPDLPVSVSVIGDGINIVDEAIEVNEDKTFSWTYEIDSETPFQNVEISFKGDDLIGELSYTEPYYGVNWESSVLEEINSVADKDEFGKLVMLYDKGLKIDEKAYNQNADVYNTRLFALCPYDEFSDISAACTQIEYVVKHSKVTRNEIEELLTSSIDILKEAGFDDAGFDKLTKTQRNGFYVDASLISVDAYKDTVETIADKLNDIIEEIEKIEEEKNKKPSKSSGGGSGKGKLSGGAATYNVTLVEEKEEPKEEINVVEQFADASMAPWANEALLYMRKEGIMNGDGVNVRPNDTITRGEFTKILVTAFKLSSDKAAQSFKDAEGKWWNEYALIASGCGIMNGMGDGSFGGDDVITREMLAVTIDRVILAKNIELYDQNEENAFEDSEEISDYAKEAIKRLALKGIVSGIGNNLFAPKLTVTRAEAAQIVYNVLKQL